MKNVIAEKVGTGTILLVEDEAGLLSATTACLRQRGHAVFPAATSAEAMELWDLHAEEIDLLITDVKLPGTSGTHLAAVLLELKPGLKVIFETAHVNQSVAIVMAFDENARLLEKPFHLEELTGVVEAVLLS